MSQSVLHWYSFTLSAVLVPQYKGIKLLESTQRSVVRMGKSLGGKIYKEQLRSLGLFSPEQRRVRGGLRAACSLQGTER